MPLEAAQLNASVIFKRRLQDTLATGFLHCYLSTLQHQVEGRNGVDSTERVWFFNILSHVLPSQCQHSKEGCRQAPCRHCLLLGSHSGGSVALQGSRQERTQAAMPCFSSCANDPGVPFQNWEAALLKFNEDFIRKANKFAVPFRPVYAHKK